jgi:hypothetical protein
MADLKRRLDRASAGLERSCAIPRGREDDGRRACITPAPVVLWGSGGRNFLKLRLDPPRTLCHCIS